jgi:proline iminopeptidase
VLKFFFVLTSLAGMAASQVTGMVKTPDVDLATFVYGPPGTTTPIIVANGGPGLSHIYMRHR